MLDLIYTGKMALLTDLYQITMAYGYWKMGRVEDDAVFHLFYRRAPFGGSYAIACGLEMVVDYLSNFRFEEDDIEYLATLTGNDGFPLFEKGFLDYLRDLELDCDIAAVPEGTVTFPYEPILRVKGSLIQCQLLETPLLNIINFQTLCATKASRICDAAQGEPVFEFGLRRAQGIDGALAASRAAYIGGCIATSNVLAGKLFGIPVKGTHAHSWVMSFDSEEEAFQQYAEAMPNNCVFLVDTYNTIEGVKNAVKMGRKLRERGHEMVGIRLDSGDMAELSRKARDILDEGGFPDARIVASNDLDEHAITDLKQRGAKIGIWGVGTKLVTAYDQPALGGVYKLSAIKRSGGAWEDRVKLSEEKIKVSNPGMQQVRRYKDSDGFFIGDGIYDERTPPQGKSCFSDVAMPDRQWDVNADVQYEDLLVPVFEQGQCVYTLPGLNDIQARSLEQLNSLRQAYRKQTDAASYFVGLEESLDQLKNRLIAEKVK
ncbi:MAG: nicotinate phosphoribosyltransferase [Pontiellaceae bacterium]|nr:nicotinate phosphoribosyltransferase [Pontiellaceae bacterium]MBN2784293.1 nicotinate phosphoribosyltransferase [Pontiellaceae bacterium]